MTVDPDTARADRRADRHPRLLPLRLLPTLFLSVVVAMTASAQPAAPPPAAPAATATAPRSGLVADIGVEIFERISPSVVQIVVENAPGGRARFSEGVGVSTGSGFVWDNLGHIVTNAHVVSGALQVFVRFASGDVAEAKVVGLAPTYDLAVVRIAAQGALPPPVPIGSSGDLKVGQSVFAIGNPFGLDQTMTSGIVSALKRRLPTVAGREIAGAIQTDASINPGNSGGPLLDSAGALVGVTSAILSPSGANAGIGFAIPVDLVLRVVPELIRNGHVGVPGIGVTVADESVAARVGVQRGLVVVGVSAGSPAQRAGLRGVDLRTGTLGDIIVAADGMPISSWSDLVDSYERAGVGGTVTLTLVNNSAQREVRVDVIDVSDAR